MEPKQGMHHKCLVDEHLVATCHCQPSRHSFSEGQILTYLQSTGTEQFTYGDQSFCIFTLSQTINSCIYKLLHIQASAEKALAFALLLNISFVIVIRYTKDVCSMDCSVCFYSVCAAALKASGFSSSVLKHSLKRNQNGKNSQTK